jgi:DNA-binding HxlR family transcriptional regulator
MMINDKQRSGCPVSLGLDIFGDRWTLLIVRDLMFSGKRHFREMLHSGEGVSSNILADRLQSLVAEGIVTRSGDPHHRQKVVYSLTEKGIDLLPILMQISRWSYKYRPVGEAYLGGGGSEQDAAVDWERRMADLRQQHLARPEQPPGR